MSNPDFRIVFEFGLFEAFFVINSFDVDLLIVRENFNPRFKVSGNFKVAGWENWDLQQ